MPSSQHLYLTGYRGTGKSSVGGIVAQQLGMPLVDLDDLVEKNAGRSIRQIFSDGGEPEFRRLESEALRQLSDPASVISLGGGAILDPANRDWIGKHGVCVWLDADAETLSRRIHGDETTSERRPALTQLGGIEEIQQLLAIRRPLYEAVSNGRVDTVGKTLEVVSGEVISFYRQST